MAAKTKKISLSLPAELLREAQLITGSGITATIQEGLLELRRKKLRSGLLRLKGRVKFDLDLERTRR